MKSRLLLSAIALIALISAPQTAQAKETGTKKNTFSFDSINTLSYADIFGYSCLTFATILALKQVDYRFLGDYSHSTPAMSNKSKLLLGLGFAATGFLTLKREGISSYLGRITAGSPNQKKNVKRKLA